MTLDDEIEQWDGRSTPTIEAVYSRHQGKAQFAKRLVHLFISPPHQSGATWLLKKAFESGLRADAGLVREISGTLPSLVEWQAMLHVLQCLPYLTIDVRTKPRVQAFLERGREHDRPFVRAWAYNGFGVLARQHPDLRASVRRMLTEALKTEKASVKARIRACLDEAG